jgi:ADP-heptose:LPS heptosyltransferase
MTSAAREILVLHPGALGDVLQSVPALRALRGAGGGRLTFAGQPRLGRLLVGAGVADAALAFDALGLEHLFTAAPIPPPVRDRLTRYDLTVSWFGSGAEPFAERLRSAARETLCAAPTPAPETDRTVWRHLLESVRPWTAPGIEPVEPLAVPAEWRDAARAALEEAGPRAGRARLLVHPGAGAAWKRWPVESFAAAVRSITDGTGCQVIIHQGPADREPAEALGRLLGPAALVLAEPSLEVLAGALVEADAYLGGDAGVSHLAAAVGACAIVVFPPATYGRWAPWSPTATRLCADDAGVVERAARAAAGCLLTR